MKQDFIAVVCNSLDDMGLSCGCEFITIPKEHHNLFYACCPVCGTYWRIFHESHAIAVEYTKVDGLPALTHESVSIVHGV